ncbi:MAG TPA: hypothetical protein VKR60_04525 [Candidatus Sulfotelmatobacter sp.]|nr:hypothetical protein [Candidatus Sulfotelmatobacter sp.]
MTELRAVQKLLLSAEVDPRVLTDFRDALNRVRNTAWAAQQSVASRQLDEGTEGVVSLLAAERVRTAFQLCRSIQGDLGRNDIRFQRGQLTELYGAATQLTEQLKERL